MSVYETEYIEGYQTYQRGDAQVSPYIGDADNTKNTAWNQGWVDAFNDYEGSVGNLMPGGSDTSGQGGGFGNDTITVNADGTVTSTPRASIAPSGLGSVANGSVAPLPIVGIENIAGDVNVGGKLYANRSSIIDDTLDVRLDIVGHAQVHGAALEATGGTGAASASRLIGGNSSGHPTTGTWRVLDIAPDASGNLWLCTVAGTPGTWRKFLSVSSTTTTLPGLSPHIYYASQNGAVLDTNLSTGGGTDDTAALQAVLNNASGGTPIMLVMDGPARVTGLNVYGNTTILCLEGAGFYLANGANRTILRNATPSASVVTDKTILLVGGVYNANATNQTGAIHAGEQDSLLPALGWYGVTNLFYDRVTIKNGYQYAASHSLCTNVVVRDCEVQQGLSPGRDGFHFFGGCSIIRGWGNKGQTGSDFFAFNGTDYLDQTAGTFNWVQNQGDISDVIVGDTSLQASANGIALLSADHDVDDVTVRGLHGSCRDYALSLWNAWSSTHQGGHIKRVVAENITARASTATPLTAHPCIVYMANPNVGTPGAIYVENVHITDVQWDNSQDTRPWLYIDSHVTIDVLHIDGFSVNERTGRATPGPIIENHGTIGLLIIDGLIWNRPGESAAGYVVNNAGTISQLQLNYPVVTNLSDFVTNSGTITQSQILATTTEMVALDFKPTGKPGATAASTYGGGTASGAPTTGPHTLGEFVVDQTGSFWICTAGGTPGTWVATGGTVPSQVDGIGLASARPAAASKPAGYVYASTDSKVLERTNGSAWEQIGEWGAGGSSTLAADSDVALSGLLDGNELQFSSADSKWHNVGIRGRITPPPTGVWSWVNQGSATIDETTGLYLAVPIDNTDTWRGRWKTAPATPYVIDIYLEPWINVGNFSGFSVGWRNSGSGNMVLLNQFINTGFAAYYRMNVGKANTTSITTNYLATEMPLSEWYPWLRIADDGTNRICSVSRDGLHWLQIHSVGRTDYITPDQVGFAVESRNATWPASAAILSWREH